MIENLKRLTKAVELNGITYSIVAFITIYTLGLAPINRNLYLTALIALMSGVLFLIGLVNLKKEMLKYVLILVCILCVYLGASLLQYSLMDVVKDVVRLLFFGAGCLFTFSRLPASKRSTDIVVSSVLVSGILLSAVLYFFILKFGLYYIYSGHETILMGISSHILGALFYNPLITFSSIFLTLYGLYKLTHSRLSALYLIPGVILFIPVLLVVLRFHTAYYFFIALLFILKFFSRKYIFSILTIFALTIAAVAFSSPEYILNLLTSFSDKIFKLGATQKITEFKAVIATSDTWISVIFGNGLGKKYFNPIYNGERLYTHSIISYTYLKFGLLGVIPILFLIFKVCKKLVLGLIRPVDNNPYVFIFSASWGIVLLSSFFFQTSYSYFSYFIILYIALLPIEDFYLFNRRSSNQDSQAV